MIKIKRKIDLNIKEKLEINKFILHHFSNSRLNNYEYVIYIQNDLLDIIGFIGIYYINEYLSLNQLCIDNNYRNKGYATNLINFILDLYKEIPIILYIDKNKENTDNLYNFYSKKGFKEISYLKNHNLNYDKENEILMIYSNKDK